MGAGSLAALLSSDSGIWWLNKRCVLGYPFNFLQWTGQLKNIEPEFTDENIQKVAKRRHLIDNTWCDIKLAFVKKVLKNFVHLMCITVVALKYSFHTGEDDGRGEGEKAQRGEKEARRKI